MQITPAPRPDFDREQWTTTGVRQLVPGDVFAIQTAPLRPVVLTGTETVPPSGWETHGWTVVSFTDPASGDHGETKLRSNTSVVIRCDLAYTITR